MANQLYMPNLLQSFNQGVDRGRQNRLAKLAGQAYTTAPEGRNALLGEIASISPRAAQQIDTDFQRKEVLEQKTKANHAKKLNNIAQAAAAAIESGDPARIKGVGEAIGPILTQITGKPFPGLDESQLPAIYKLMAATGGSAQTKGVEVGNSLINPYTGEVIYKGQKELPSSIQKLKYLQAHPELAQFDLERRKASRPTTTVNLGKQTSAFAKALGSANAKLFTTLRDNARTAQTTLGLVNQIQPLLASTDTGKTQEVLAKIGQYFGTPAGKSMQKLQAYMSRFVLPQAHKLGSGSGFSDKDLEFLTAGFPGFGKSKEANQRVIRMMKQMAENEIKLYQDAQGYVSQHGNLAGYEFPLSIMANNSEVNDGQAPSSDTSGWSIKEIK